MMPTKVVSFREDEEALRYVREQGLNPSEVAKEAFEKEIQHLRTLGALEWLRQNPLPSLGRRAEDLIRETRDER